MQKKIVTKKNNEGKYGNHAYTSNSWCRYKYKYKTDVSKVSWCWIFHSRFKVWDVNREGVGGGEVKQSHSDKTVRRSTLWFFASIWIVSELRLQTAPCRSTHGSSCWAYPVSVLHWHKVRCCKRRRVPDSSVTNAACNRDLCKEKIGKLVYCQSTCVGRFVLAVYLFSSSWITWLCQCFLVDGLDSSSLSLCCTCCVKDVTVYCGDIWHNWISNFAGTLTL